MSDGNPSPEFASQAKDAGLVLPEPKRTNPWFAAAICAVVIGASLGIGYDTGWFNPHTQTVGYSHPASCQSPLARLTGAVAPTTSSLLNGTFEDLTSNYSASTGSCIAFTLVDAPGASALQDLGNGSSSFVLTGAPYPATAMSGLSETVFQVPLLLGAIAVVVNLPGAPAGLNLTGNVLAGLYLGAIPAWNATPIAALNPGAELGGAPPVTVVHQAGLSGVNEPFTQFLAQSNATWNLSVGAGPSVAWPTGPGANGSAGVLEYVAATPGAIGYVEAGDLTGTGVQQVRLQNLAGAFTAPNSTATSAAAQSVAFESAAANQSWGSIEWGNSTDTVSYPLDEFGYAVLFSDLGKAYGGALSDYDGWWLLSFFEWALNGGQSLAVPRGLAAVPPSLISLDASVLTEVSYNGTSILTGPSEEGTEPGGETGEF